MKTKEEIKLDIFILKKEHEDGAISKNEFIKKLKEIREECPHNYILNDSECHVCSGD